MSKLEKQAKMPQPEEYLLGYKDPNYTGALRNYAVELERKLEVAEKALADLRAKLLKSYTELLGEKNDVIVKAEKVLKEKDEEIKQLKKKVK